jgi:hypothetical protein
VAGSSRIKHSLLYRKEAAAAHNLTPPMVAARKDGGMRSAQKATERLYLSIMEMATREGYHLQHHEEPVQVAITISPCSSLRASPGFGEGWPRSEGQHTI